MPSLAEHHSSNLVKLMYIGDSGSGKTGSLVSLVKAGYKLRILDMDNGLDVLSSYIKHECPDKLGNVSYITERDSYTEGPVYANGTIVGKGPVCKSPRAYVNALKHLEKWDDDSIPAEWGPDTVFVVDSLTSLGRAALEWARGMNPSAKDGRQWYGTAQASLENVLSKLTSAEFNTNVIIISHIKWDEDDLGNRRKGYASSVGAALGPIIPRYFNTLVLAETDGQGKNTKRRIKHAATGLIDLKVPSPFKFDDPLPLETGMNDLFNKLKE